MIKRLADLLIASVLLVLTFPVMVAATVGCAIVLRAWPFFVQHRVGLHGRDFRFLKLRTLPRSTPAYLLKKDLSFSKVPLFTRTLRALHFDELPQLLLVLTGQMSLVGPRPEMREFHDQLDPDFAAARTTVRPGCTGLWQISVACDGLIGDTPEYDRVYLANRSLRLDLWILAKTTLMMLGFTKPSELDGVPTWTLASSPAVPALAPHDTLELVDADLSA